MDPLPWLSSPFAAPSSPSSRSHISRAAARSSADRRRDAEFADPPRRPFGPIDGCPICDSSGTRFMTDEAEPGFYCFRCSATWRYELGHVLVTS